MKKTFFVCALFLLSIFSAFTQQQNKNSLNERCFGGEPSMQFLLKAGINYPVESKKNEVIGTSLSSIEISPSGSIVNISIINPVDAPIDSAVTSALKSTADNWRPDSTITLMRFFIFK